jgi:5-methylcytosine-specific restriction endonuclease McrA
VSLEKKAVRRHFRLAVFTRDGYRCAACERPGVDRQAGPGTPLDAHHIYDRSLMPGGGYVVENGVSLCDECHLKAESHWAPGVTPEPGFSPGDLYAMVGSSYEKALAAAKSP